MRADKNRQSLLHAALTRSPTTARYGLARVLSKAGICSRTQAAQWISAGRVQVNGRIIRAAEYPTHASDVVLLDGKPLPAPVYHYLMLHKPRGLMTTASDEQGRATVYDCLHGAPDTWLAPVGRLDKASEGLLLFSNDSRWAAQLTDPCSHLHKTYHVQVAAVPDAAQLQQMQSGVPTALGLLMVQQVRLLRSGGKTAWLEVVLNEGKNRQIRRILQALDLPVRRLIRTSIGHLQLGTLGKGQWRALSAREVTQLALEASHNRR